MTPDNIGQCDEAVIVRACSRAERTVNNSHVRGEHLHNRFHNEYPYGSGQPMRNN